MSTNLTRKAMEAYGCVLATKGPNFKSRNATVVVVCPRAKLLDVVCPTLDFWI